jgi:hypothetical protein
MNNEPTTDERQKLIAAAADSYTAPPPQSHTLLMPIRESLATLRHKGASYRTIAQILRNVDIEVSLDTLSRFCREYVEEPPPRKDKRRPVSRAASGQPGTRQTGQGDGNPATATRQRPAPRSWPLPNPPVHSFRHWAGRKPAC